MSTEGASLVTKISSTVAVLASGLWAGGLITLGAVAAPIVFDRLSAPTSGDVMTPVFRRFDSVALGCAAVVVLVEVVRAAAKEQLARLDALRIAAATFAAGLVVWQAMFLSPQIEALHRGGAVRGSGEAGLALEHVHWLAERQADAQLLLVALVVALHVFGASRPRPTAGAAKAATPAELPFPG